MTWFRCGMKKSSCVNQLDELMDGSIVEITSDVTTLREYLCYGCNLLETVSMQNVTVIPQSCFRGCTLLTNVDIPNIQAIGLRAFSYSGITSLDTKLHNISNYAFSSSSINTLIMRDNYVASLSDVNAFESTPFDANGAGGTIYVPSDLVSTYEADVKWAALLALNANNKIEAISA